MKYSILLLLPLFVGCSLIRINEVRPEPEHKPRYLGLTIIQDENDVEVKIRRDQVSSFGASRMDAELCGVRLVGSDLTLRARISCNELDAELSK